MKTWTIPVATAQQFAANDYVSACYYIKCGTPQGNKRYQLLAYDTNGNGVYDKGTDEIFYNPPRGWASGCGGTHLARIEGPIENNGLAIIFPGNNSNIEPRTDATFLWNGYVKDVSDPNADLVYDSHGTDLSVADAYRIDDETNFS